MMLQHNLLTNEGLHKALTTYVTSATQNWGRWSHSQELEHKQFWMAGVRAKAKNFQMVDPEPEICSSGFIDTVRGVSELYRVTQKDAYPYFVR